jgi:hypothetical protein
MIGLITGAEIYGVLPQAAAGRVGDFFNSEIAGVITVTRAVTEDLGNTEVSELVVLMQHVTYVQPWAAGNAAAMVFPSQTTRGHQQVEVHLVLRTRIHVSGIATIAPGLDITAVLGRATEQYISFRRASITTPNGQSREAPGVLVNREHVMLARRADASGLG